MHTSHTHTLTLTHTHTHTHTHTQSRIPKPLVLWSGSGTVGMAMETRMDDACYHLKFKSIAILTLKY